MKHYIKSAVLLAAAALLCGCAQIPDRKPAEESAPAAQTAEAKPPEYEELSAAEYEIIKTDVQIKLNAEGGVFTGNVRTDGEYDGSGYIVLDEGMTLTHIATLPSSQHYRIALAVQSFDGAEIKLTISNETVGMYYAPPMEEMKFQLFAIDSLYLPEGPSILTFTAEHGTVSLDYILVESSSAVGSFVYRTAASSVSRNSSVAAIGTMKYLAENYGSRIITGQNVTPGTNAEINAILAETGRSPALRCGELAPITLTDDSSTETMQKEQELALDWGKKGGLVSYKWHWYSPDGAKSVYADLTDYDIAAVLKGQDAEQLALAGSEELAVFLENDIVTEEMCTLLAEIDKAAEFLKALDKENIAVIWQPLPDADASAYWWGKDAESYRTLWKLIFTRLNSYHSLGNLIWVWNGSSTEYYPGDKFCDIIGQSLYENSSASFAGRFAALARVSPTDTKPVAITACDRLPNPNYMLRDNALWLWFAIGSGESIINTDGTLSEVYTDWQSLHDCYNSKICVTLDELPDFSDYAIG